MNHRSTAARIVLGLMLVTLAVAPRASADNGTDTVRCGPR